MISRSSPFRRAAGLVGVVAILAACTSSGASVAPSTAASQAAPSTAASEAAPSTAA